MNFNENFEVIAKEDPHLDPITISNVIIVVRNENTVDFHVNCSFCDRCDHCF